LTRRCLAAALVWCAAAVVRAEETAVYRVRGADARLFDQYDNDGYSLSVSARGDGWTELTVRVSDAPLQTAGPRPDPARRDGAALAEAPDRDAYARELAGGARSTAETVRRVLLGLRATLSYDPDRLRRQDPAAVFASRRGYCVGFAELAVDLLRRVGVRARTVQGILHGPPGSDHFESAIGGAYHRWIEVYYPDRGYVFSDPWASIDGVDARYLPFATRSLVRPADLVLETVEAPRGPLAYEKVRAGEAEMRVRRVAAP
jgi:transglutaminase-like putative cysteine protease